MKHNHRAGMCRKVKWLVCRMIGRKQPPGCADQTKQGDTCVPVERGAAMAEVMEANRKIDETKHLLLLRAGAAHSSIRPCGGRKVWDDCFTVENEHLVLWFDDCTSKSTHVVTTPLRRLELDTKSLVMVGLIDENGRFRKDLQRLIREETHGGHYAG